MNVLFTIIHTSSIYHPQHPFISKVPDRKPVQDLISEYKAEVVEEVMDADEDAAEVIFCFRFPLLDLLFYLKFYK